MDNYREGDSATPEKNARRINLGFSATFYHGRAAVRMLYVKDGKLLQRAVLSL